MNYRLLLTFLAAQAFEFSFFYAIATGISLAANSRGYNVDVLKAFAALVGIDLLGAVLVYSDRISDLVKQLFSREV